MGRSAHVPNAIKVDHSVHERARTAHHRERSVGDVDRGLGGVGLRELEALLAKHAAFLGFLETVDD